MDFMLFDLLYKLVMVLMFIFIVMGWLRLIDLYIVKVKFKSSVLPQILADGKASALYYGLRWCGAIIGGAILLS